VVDTDFASGTFYTDQKGVQKLKELRAHEARGKYRTQKSMMAIIFWDIKPTFQRNVLLPSS
jgi:hypothetical protein